MSTSPLVFLFLSCSICRHRLKPPNTTGNVEACKFIRNYCVPMRGNESALVEDKRELYLIVIKIGFLRHHLEITARKFLSHRPSLYQSATLNVDS